MVFWTGGTTSDISGTGTASMVIRDGNVGIGTTSPGDSLDVQSGNINTLGAYKIGGGNVWLTYTNNLADLYSASGVTLSYFNGSAGTVGLKLANGNVGIGTTNPVIGLQVEKDNGNGWTALFRKDASSNGVLIGSQGGVSTIAAINSALGTFQSLVFNPGDGNVGIGTTSPGAKLDINGDLKVATTTTSQTFVELSSRRIKENIIPLQDSLSKILNLTGVTFNKIGNTEQEIGFIAEDVEVEYPQLIQKDSNNIVIGLQYSRMTAILVEAIKQLNSNIESQSKLISLQSDQLKFQSKQIEYLMNRLEKLK